MRDAIAWSYDLLSLDDQRLFRQLSVFVGGFTMQAAEMVACTNARIPLDGVASLVDASLVSVSNETDGVTRYLMLESIREFGVETLGASEEELPTR